MGFNSPRRAPISRQRIEPKEIAACLRDALQAITAPRFYETERGFQGQLLVELGRRLNLAAPALVEQEYQKTKLLHGLTIRPDIVIHEPFDPERHRHRADGNLAAIELKRRGTPARSRDDYTNLATMLRVLRYPVAFFINIASTRPHAHLTPPEAEGGVIPFAVSLRAGRMQLVEERG